jgi:uncharacterized protein (DUF58 family)
LTANTQAAEALAAGLPKLLLAAERLAHVAAPGAHGRRRPGQGEDFWQYRDFRDGDDARRIDWRRSAGADRLFLREREWEAQASIALALHDTAGLDYRSSPALPAKRERAMLLLLATASLLLRAGERVALAGKTPPLTGIAALRTLAAGFMAGGPVAVDPKSRVVAFGDFLEPAPVFYAAPGGAVVQILDPAECDFPFSGRILFEGFGKEAGIEAARAEDWAVAYRARIAAQRAVVMQAAERAGQTLLFHRTDAPPASVLAALYQALNAV